MNYLINNIIKENEKIKDGVQNIISTNTNINKNLDLKSDEKTKKLENDLAIKNKRIIQLEEELRNCIVKSKLNEIKPQNQNKYEMFEKNYKKEYIKYDKFMYLALLAEQYSCYDDMLYFIERFVAKKDDLLSLDESNVFSLACRNNIKKFRESIRTIKAYKSKEKNKSNSEFLDYIIDYEKFMEDEMYDNIQEILKFIDVNIIKKSNYKEYSDELKIFYIKMKADYNKYFAETDHSKKKEYEREAEKYYDEAEKMANKISFSNAIKLGLLLNKSVFLYEIKENHVKAIELANSTIKEFDKIKKKLNKDDDNSKDVFQIYDLFKKNLELWEK